MKALTLLAVLITVGCIDLVDFGYLEEQLNPGSVTCDLLNLEVAANQETQCRAWTVDGTEIAGEGVALVAWTSAAPNIISVNLLGVIRAEDAGFISEGIPIIACGPDDCAQVLVATR